MRGTAAILAGLIVAAAAAAPPSPPVGARPYERGPHDTAVLACLDAVTPALRPGFGRLDFTRFIVPAGMGWDSVAAHYAAALPGWKAERIPEQQAGCRLRAWSGDGGHLAVALTEPFEPGFRVLAVVTPAP